MTIRQENLPKDPGFKQKTIQNMQKYGKKSKDAR